VAQATQITEAQANHPEESDHHPDMIPPEKRFCPSKLILHTCLLYNRDLGGREGTDQIFEFHL
jgi:hypothetical protein